MKKSIFIFLLLFLGNRALAQNWGPWITVYKNGDHVVEVSYKSGNCKKAKWGFSRTRNSHELKGCWISFKMDYTSCEGNGTSQVTVYLDKVGVTQSSGDWFPGNDVLRPFYGLTMNGRCADKKDTDKDNGNGNGGTKELVFPAAERTQYRNLKSTVSASINKLDQNAFKSDFRNRYRDLTTTPDDELSKEEYLRRASGLESLQAEIEKEKEAQEKLKEKNKTLEQRIRAEISNIQAPDARSRLSNEFSGILSSAKDEETKTSKLEAFLEKVQAEAAQINSNFKKAEENKEVREEQINQLRKENQEIKKEQANIVSTYTDAAGSLLAISGRTGKGSNYEGGSYKFSLKFGLMGLVQPIGYTDHMKGTRLIKSSGQLMNIDELHAENDTYPMPGIFLSAELHPWFSNYGSIGFTGSAAFTYWPESHSDVVYGGLNTGGNYKNRTVNFEYGVEATIGVKAIKLLAKAHYQNLEIESGDLYSSTFDSPVETTEISNTHYTDQKWKSVWAAAGIRLGDYLKSDWFLDLAYTAYIPQRINGKKTSFQFSDMLPGADQESPSGFYAQLSKQNGWVIKLHYIKKYILLNEKDNKMEYSKKAMFSLSIGKSLEWFGAPYKKKKKTDN